MTENIRKCTTLHSQHINTDKWMSRRLSGILRLSSGTGTIMPYQCQFCGKGHFSSRSYTLHFSSIYSFIHITFCTNFPIQFNLIFYYSYIHTQYPIISLECCPKWICKSFLKCSALQKKVNIFQKFILLSHILGKHNSMLPDEMTNYDK